jgi:hypothetical protein
VLSVIDILPLPTLLFSDCHEYEAPFPTVISPIVFFMFGSNLSHGDHLLHAPKSFTIANTASGLDLIVMLRDTCTLEGRNNDITQTSATIAISTIKIRFNIFIID